MRAALERLAEKEGVIRTAEAVFSPREDDNDYGGIEGWGGHSGDKFLGPLLDRGIAGEQGGLGDMDVVVDRTFADRAAAHSERCEEAEKGNPFKSTG